MPETLPPPTAATGRARIARALKIGAGVLLVLVVVGGTCVGFAPLGSNLEQARVTTTENTLRALGSALKIYYSHHGKYPDASEGLQALVTDRILESPPKDAWNHVIAYTVTDGRYRIVSYGADGQPGGTGNATDLVLPQYP
jgi:general secretion pathway protein G